MAPDEPGMSLLSSAADLDDLSPGEADVPARFWGAEAFLVLGMTLRSQSALIRACRAHGSGIVALDFCPLYNVDKKAEALELVGHADVFLADLADMRFVLGDVGPEPGARYFAKLGPRVVAIRMGELGCLVYDRGQDRCFVQPPYRSATVDRTGSGDAFCSAFMACMIQPGATLEWAAAAGAVAASFASSAHGTEGLFAARPLDAAKRLALYLRPPKA